MPEQPAQQSIQQSNHEPVTQPTPQPAPQPPHHPAPPAVTAVPSSGPGSLPRDVPGPDVTRPLRPRVAYVLPVYNEGENLAYFHATLVGALRARPDLQVEFVYVDDGSRDDSLDQLLMLREQDPRVTVLSLSRNRGHQTAVTAGLDVVEDADAVIVMDTDLQDPPSISLEMVHRWELGADVVYGQRRSRQDTHFKRWTAFAFYWVLDKLSDVAIPRNTGDFRLMDRRVVAEVARYREHDRFLRGIVAHVGFRQEALLFDRDARFAGTSGYPLRTMLRFAANGIIGFSTTPLSMISRLGGFISALSVLVAAYIAGVKIFTPEHAVPGWAFLGVGMFLLSGLQIMMIGVIGSYLGRVYAQSQGRPLYSLALFARGVPAGTPRRPDPAELGLAGNVASNVGAGNVAIRGTAASDAARG
ncbi:glycosyltransferase family 2 protein [Nocardioides sp. GY 10127]|uniref:glycosyltransferase family 2 protein n=1 Tax=Nocardioides sp. GY 10127 TaxID=2569762 RepID=UPI0010A7AC8A|nr:glycosyltransferase family 2 protein [Nocardioides sp. GY 10127]TIC79430.1 glycosyltransferase family 2 protein [Nocardioides sp. GY 10127]